MNIQRFVSCVALFAATPLVLVAQQQAVPVRDVAAPAFSSEHFVATPNLRQLPGEKVLVNDLRGKRLLVFDSTLKTFTTSADSNGTNGTVYPSFGGLANPLMRYFGDSSLFIDFQAHAYLVIDPAGHVAHAMAAPRANDLVNVSVPYAGLPNTDAEGRVIYRGSETAHRNPKKGEPPNPSTRDTVYIVRADFNTRSIDTVASFNVPIFSTTVVTDNPNGKPVGTRKVDPIPAAPDDWAVMADGSVAIVREHDYHVDWIASDKSVSSTAKLPYDWRRLTDEDKRARIDSMKKIVDSISATGRMFGTLYRYNRQPDGSTKTDTIVPMLTYASIAEIPDYMPPIKQGSTKADADNNLWILPTTSSQAGKGLVYDVVNKKDGLFERVRLPADCVLAGFGKGGVIFVSKFDSATKTWTLGRTRIVATRAAM